MCFLVKKMTRSGRTKGWERVADYVGGIVIGPLEVTAKGLTHQFLSGHLAGANIYEFAAPFINSIFSKWPNKIVAYAKAGVDTSVFCYNAFLMGYAGFTKPQSDITSADWNHLIVTGTYLLFMAVDWNNVIRAHNRNADGGIQAAKSLGKGIGGLPRKIFKRKKGNNGGGNEGGANESVNPNVWVSVDPKKGDEYLKTPNVVEDYNGDGVLDQTDIDTQKGIDAKLELAVLRAERDAYRNAACGIQDSSKQQGDLERITSAIEGISQRLDGMEGRLQNYEHPNEKSS